jgi:hypothetical protein
MYINAGFLFIVFMHSALSTSALDRSKLAPTSDDGNSGSRRSVYIRHGVTHFISGENKKIKFQMSGARGKKRAKFLFLFSISFLFPHRHLGFCFVLKIKEKTKREMDSLAEPLGSPANSRPSLSLSPARSRALNN